MGRGRKTSFLKLAKNVFLDILFPEYCVACGSFLLLDHYYIACEDCWKSFFKEFKGKKCKLCGFPLKLKPGIGDLCRECYEKKRKFFFDKVEYFGLYNDLIDISLKALKFEKRKPIGLKIGETIKSHFLNFLKKVSPDFVVPVPLSEERMKERGFNQCEVILEGAEISYVPLAKKLFNPKRQSELSAEDREKNIKGVFEVSYSVEGKKVLIFDDVFTTGSTCNELAKELKKSGAKKVFVYTVARSV
ncbi:MAG: ComF family protein [Desulfurobacteriaceae bacterium]